MLRGSLVFAVLLVAAVVAAEEYKAGDKVVVVKRAKLTVEKGDTLSVFPGASLTVTEVEGDRISVSGGGAPGWLEKGNVVPFSKGLDYFTNALKGDPANAELRYARGMLRENSGDLDGAIADCDVLIRNDPKAAFYNLRAIVWHKKRELDRTIADLNEAIRLDPNSAAAYAIRGDVRMLMHELDKAIADFDDALRIDPTYSRGYAERGFAWGEKHEYDKAIADFDEAVRLEPKWSGAYIGRGRVWTAAEDYVKAVADFDVAILLDPTSAHAFTSRAIAWEKTGEHDKAIADCNEAIRLEPKSAVAYEGRANVWHYQKAYANAIADFETAIRLDPSYSMPYNNLAWLLATCPAEKFRNGKKALELATKQCELAKWRDDGFNFDTLAAAYAEAGQLKNAVEYETKAVNLINAEDKPDYQKRLDLYKAGKPYREPPKKK